MLHLERERPLRGLDVDRTELGAFRGAVRDHVVALRQQGRLMVVDAQHLRALDLRQVLIEPVDDGLERAVVVEVIDLHVGEDRAVQGQLEVCAVALVGLHHQPLATGPLGTGAHVGDVATDHEAGPQAGLGQHQHQHRGGGGLAVGARHPRSACPRTDGGQHARAVHREHAHLVGLVALDVALGNGRAPGDGIAVVHQLAVVADVHLHTSGPHAVEHRRSRMSLPLTSWPISASTMAIALMPGPPTPTTWRSCAVERSSGAVGGATWASGIAASATRSTSGTRRPLRCSAPATWAA